MHASRPVFPISSGVLSLLCALWITALQGAPSLEVQGPQGESLVPGLGSNVLVWGGTSPGQHEVPATLGAVKAIAAGGGHTTALRADGKVVSWGQISNGITIRPAKAPAGLTGVTAVAAAWSHSVALRGNGTVADWGYIYDVTRGYTKPVVPKGLRNVVAIAAGFDHTVALRQDGSVTAWGYNGSGQTTVPVAAQSEVVSIAAGGSHTVALRQDGSVIAWGRNRDGQTTVPAAAQSEVVAIAAGSAHTVALRQDGRVIAWGDNWAGQTTVPEAAQSGVVAIAAGGWHTVALRQDGRVIAWGDNNDRQTTVPAAAQSGVVAIAAGDSHTVALRQDARDFGTLNVGQQRPPITLTLRNSGDAALTLKSVALVGGQSGDFVLDQAGLGTSLAAGASTALRLAFKPKAVGARTTTLRITSTDPSRPTFDVVLTGLGQANIAPQLARPQVFFEATSQAGAVVTDLRSNVIDPGDLGSMTTQFGPAEGSTFPLGDTRVQVTATDTGGQSLIGSFTVSVIDRTAPVITSLPADMVVDQAVPGGAEVTFADATATDALGVTSITYSHPSGSLFPRGLTMVQVTARDAAGHTTQATFQVRVRPAEVRVESTSSFPVFGSHQAIAWGSSRYGQTTVPVAAQSGVVAIAAGGAHTVALRQDGSVIAWGYNWYGITTVPVAAQSGVVAIAAGGNHTVALRQDGRVIAWGYYESGQTTVPVAAQSGVLAIAAGAFHTVALRQDGSVIAWGDNGSGQTTVPVAAQSGVLAIAAGAFHTVALRQDGRVIAWGNNGDGQTTVPVAAQSAVVAIAAGGAHTVALRQDGSVIAWGSNGYGQTTVPVAAQSAVVAIAAGGAHTVALRQDGSFIAWGSNRDGQTTVPVAAQSGVVAIDAGGSHTVALRPNYEAPAGLTTFPGATNLGGQGTVLTFTLRNPGQAPLLISSLAMTGGAAADFQIDTADMLTAVPAGGSTTFRVTFRPTAVGTRSAALRLTTNVTAVDLPVVGTGQVNTAPILSGPTSPILREATGATGATATFAVSVADSGEAAVPVSLSHSSGSLFPIGDTTVTASAMDELGLTSTLSFIVRVRDSTAPVIGGMPGIAVPQSQPEGAVVSYAAPSVTDAVGVTSVTYSHASGSVFPVGLTTVTVSARDAAGNATTRTFLIRVGVAYSLPSSPLIAEATEQGGARVSFSLPLAALSATPRGAPTISPASGSLFPLGDTAVSVTAEDANGYASQQSFIVRVRDTTAPLIQPPGNLTVPATTNTGATVTYDAPMSDAVGITSSSQSPPSGSTFPVGTSTVTLTAADAAGNQAQRSFTVTVQPPVLSLSIQREGATQPEVPIASEVIAWGYNWYGLTTVPVAAQSGVMAIAAGGAHTVALRQDGSVIAWGSNGYDQTTVPAAAQSGVVAIAAGGDHTVALRQDGGVIAWGKNWYGQTTVPAAAQSGVVAIAAGGGHTVALRQDGRVIAWGYNGSGQTTVPVAAQSGVVAIAAGGNHTVALRQDGGVIAWGYNEYGQTTVPVAAQSGVVAIAAGGWHTLALRQDGSVVAWGSNLGGQITVPVAAQSGVVAIVAGGSHTVALRQDGSAIAWGYNRDGQTTLPAAAQSGVMAIAAGGYHTVALRRAAVLDLGSASYDAAATFSKTVTLTNTGVGDVTVHPSLVAGAAAGFSIELGSSITLAAQQSATLTLRFTDSRPGAHRATLSLRSNATNLPQHYLPLLATLTQPEIALSANGLVQNSGATSDHGTVGVSQSRTLAYTLHNEGDGALNLSALSLDGPAAADFELEGISPGTLAPGQSQGFTLRFAPRTVGERRARLVIASNDRDEASFELNLIGRGSAILATNADGSPVARPEQTDDQSIFFNGTVIERSYTLRNTGDTALTGLRLVWEPAAPSDYTLSPALPSSLAVGESYTFTLRFTLQRRGSIDLRARLLADQSEDMPITLRYTGSVQAPKLAVRDRGGLLGTDGTGNRVIAWGSNGSGQTTVPVAAQSGVVAIAAGGLHTVALRQDGRVVAWGDNGSGQTTVPEAAQSGVAAIAAGGLHTVALRQDGRVIAWGRNGSGQTTVPVAAQSGVVAIAAGGDHTVALRQDGSVIAWGDNGSGQTTVPAAAQSRVVAIAAGVWHTVALRQDGSVIVWGNNWYGQTTVPAAAQSGVVAIAAGGGHTVALRQDGSVIAWGRNGSGQTTVPEAAQSEVVAIAVGYSHSVALRQDGSVIAWGDNWYGQTTVPEAAQSEVVAIAAGYYHTVALRSPRLGFGICQLGQLANELLTLANEGELNLTSLRAEITGPDADQFSIIGTLPSAIAPGQVPVSMQIRFTPTRPGPMNALLRIHSNDPELPVFYLPLTGTGLYVVMSTQAGPLTLALPRSDAQTGVILQKVAFTNTTGVALHGLEFNVMGLAARVQLYSSSVSEYPDALDVVYSRAIAAGETISFDLAYFDPLRSLAQRPWLRATALYQPEPASLPVAGTLVPQVSVRVSPPGPLLEWPTTKNAISVVEYSDDNGATWLSAVHRLTTTGTRMFWVDRGQPETTTRPTGVPNKPGGRQYRVKKL